MPQPMDAASDTEGAAAAWTLVPREASQQGAGGGKKPAVPSGRVWSEADEVRILEGLAAFVAAYGAEPRRSQLHAALGLDKSEFTVTEIYKKVQQLRSKYELSRSIWGDQPLNTTKKVAATNASASGNANANAAPDTRVRRGLEELQDLYPSLALAVEGITDDELLRPVLKRNFQLISDEKARALDAKAKKQRVMELEMMMKQTALRNQVFDLLTRSMD